MAVLLLICLVVVLIIFAPLAAIWALNQLFMLGIAYTFKSWLAALILGAIVGGSSSSSKS